MILGTCNICREINVSTRAVKGTNTWGEVVVLNYCDHCYDPSQDA
tara:strand:- start:1585 stop:1719 length:135 start_codon:yes stop_codon:yes gene_type:complete